MSNKFIQSLDETVKLGCVCREDTCLRLSVFKINNHIGPHTHESIIIDCPRCERFMGFTVSFSKAKFFLKCDKISKLIKNNEYAIEKFIYQLIFQIIQKKLNYPVQIIINQLLSNIETISNFGSHLKKHFPCSIKYNKNNITIGTLNDIYITILNIYMYFGIPLDITKIIIDYLINVEDITTKLYFECLETHKCQYNVNNFINEFNSDDSYDSNDSDDWATIFDDRYEVFLYYGL